MSATGKPAPAEPGATGTTSAAADQEQAATIAGGIFDACLQCEGMGDNPATIMLGLTNALAAYCAKAGIKPEDARRFVDASFRNVEVRPITMPPAGTLPC